MLGMLLSLFVARYAARGMRPPTSCFLSLLAVMVAWWCFMQWASPLWINQEYRYFLAQLQYIAVCATPVFWMFTALSFSGYFDFVKRWHLLFWIVPLITLMLAISNNFHGLIWQSFSIVPGNITPVIEYGRWFDVHVLYAYCLVLTGTLIMALRIGLTPQYRLQLLITLVSPIAVMAVNLPFVLGQQWLPIDPTPTGFAIGILLIALAIRRSLFLVVPVARRSTLDSLSDGESGTSRITASLGVTTRNADDPNPDALMPHADIAMCHSKKTRRNGVSRYNRGIIKRVDINAS